MPTTPPQIGNQQLVKDIFDALNRVGVVGDPKRYNAAVDRFRVYIPNPKVRGSQSIGIYARDQLTSYRGDSQAVKMLQEAYKFIQEPLVNDTYAVVKDWVNNKPDIPVLLGNVAMLTAQIPPPAGVVLSAVASTAALVASLFGGGKPPAPPPTPEDSINQQFVLEMVGNAARGNRWIWTNEARTNQFATMNGVFMTYQGQRYAYVWLKELLKTNFFGQTQTPQRMMQDSGEYGLTCGNHTQDIDVLALEDKVRTQQPDRYLWWLMYVCLGLNEYWRGRMSGSTNEEKYARTAFFQAMKHYTKQLERYLQTQTYYQKVVDVMAMLTGRMQAFFVDADGINIENLNPSAQTFDFSGNSSLNIINSYVPENNQRRAQIEQKVRQMRGNGRNGQFFISRPLVECAGAVYDLTNGDRKLLLKALRYGVLDVPATIGGGNTPASIPAFEGDADKRGILYDYLLRFAYSALPCYIEGVGVPVVRGTETRYLPNLLTFKGIRVQKVYERVGFNQWSGKIKNNFRQALDEIRSDDRLFKRCLIRKAILQQQEIERGVYRKDFLNDISISDLKAEFPTASDIRIAVNEMRQDGVPLNDKDIIQTWLYFVGGLPEGMSEEEAIRLGAIVDKTQRDNAGVINSKTILVAGAAIGAAKLTGAI